MAGDYRIFDEPQPGALEHLAVRPMWPLLAMMMAGGWLAWPWFILNSIAIGSPTRTREIVTVFISFVGTVALVAVTIALHDRGIIESELSLQLMALAIVCWKLATAYMIDQWQSRTIDVYEYYGGTVRSGLVVLVLGVIFRPGIVDGFGSGLWRQVMSIGVIS